MALTKALYTVEYIYNAMVSVYKACYLYLCTVSQFAKFAYHLEIRYDKRFLINYSPPYRNGGKDTELCRYAHQPMNVCIFATNSSVHDGTSNKGKITSLV